MLKTTHTYRQLQGQGESPRSLPSFSAAVVGSSRRHSPANRPETEKSRRRRAEVARRNATLHTTATSPINARQRACRYTTAINGVWRAAAAAAAAAWTPGSGSTGPGRAGPAISARRPCYNKTSAGAHQKPVVRATVAAAQSTIAGLLPVVTHTNTARRRRDCLAFIKTTRRRGSNPRGRGSLPRGDWAPPVPSPASPVLYCSYRVNCRYLTSIECRHFALDVVYDQPSRRPYSCPQPSDTSQCSKSIKNYLTFALRSYYEVPHHLNWKCQ